MHYKQGEPVEGFNATVAVLSCPDKCPRNRVCRQGQCLCPEGSVGPDCSDILCPNNCSADLKQGVCDKVRLLEFSTCIFLEFLGRVIPVSYTHLDVYKRQVYVYDGLPDFVSTTGSHQSHVLGVFCTQDIQYPVTVEAKSGKFSFFSVCSF